MSLFDAAWWAARIKHGAYLGGGETAEHYVWRTMIRRCYNPTSKDYANYGGRGIVVCQRWCKSYLHFLQDMGPRPSPRHSIERRNNNGPYGKRNCRWATALEQGRNKRCNRWFVHNRQRKTLAEWARHLGISKELAHWRYAQWGTFERGKVWLLQNQK